MPKSLGYVISYCGGLLVDYASIYISTLYLYIVHLIFIYGLLGQCILYPENCMTKNNFERALHIHYVCLSASQSILLLSVSEKVLYNSKTIWNIFYKFY